MGSLIGAISSQKVTSSLLPSAPATVRRAHAVHPIACVQTEYSILYRTEAEATRAVTRELGIGYVAYSPLGRGFLTGAIQTFDDVDGRRGGGGGVSELPTSGRLVDGLHVLPLRVYYEDTDAQGIVYYANWMRFLERGRTEMLRLLGQEHSALREEKGLNWVVRRCLIDYLRPARLDETIEVITRCGEMRGASLDMLQEARRGADSLVKAELLVACMGDDGRPARLPSGVKEALSQVAIGPATPRSRHIQV